MLLPAAGVLLGSAVLIGAVVYWRKKRKLSGRAKLMTGAIACVGAAVLVTGSVYAFGGKGDLNSDGGRDYTDVELLERHLIGLEFLPESRQGKADMNSDGKLTVTDLSLLIRKIEKTVDYEADLSSAKEQFHYEKGDPVELKFLADVSHGTRVQSVTVNGEEHQVEREENGSVYTVRTGAGNTAGVKKFQFSEVLLEGGQTVETEHMEKIGVLKDMPEVEGFLAEELTDTAQMKVSFTLKDEDSAVISAGMEVVNESDGTTLVSEEVKAGENEFVLDLEEDTEYGVNITVSYDRASGEFPSGENHGGSFAVTKKVELNLDYRFTFGSMKAVTEEGTETDRFGRNQPVVLLFESSNATGFVPERAVVNGKTYPVIRTEQGYSVTLDGFDSTGIKTVTAEQIVLENGKAFDLEKDNEITLQILKEIPHVKDFMVEEDAENSQFRVAFRLTDPDGALSGHKVLIRNGEGKTAGEQSFGESDLADGKYDVRISLTDTGLTNRYTVQVVADRDLTEDGTEPESGCILAEETVKAKLRILITDSKAGSVYAEKGKAVDLFYGISHNADGNLSALVVDHLEVSPEKQDGMWKASVPASDQAGVHDFTLSQVVFDDGTEAEAEHTIQAEVLKDIPTAENFAWNKTAQDELSIRFELRDEDRALQDARVKIEEEGGKVLLEENVAAGDNEVSAALTLKESYIITVIADYDRDTDAMDDQSNGYSGEVLFSQTVSASRDALEMKDITAERLYYTGGSGREEVRVLDITDGLPEDPENYYAVIEMEEMPDFYAGVREFRQDGDNGSVYAVLDQEDMIRYEADGTRVTGHAFPVAYMDEKGEYPLIASAEELFAKMASDPKGSFKLTEDLDASGISAERAAVTGTFTGELDGNGYRIKNLPTALFQTLSGAKIHDLVIEDAVVTTSQSGILANVIQNQSVIENVFLMDSSISNGVDGMGAFAGRLVNSTIRKSASVNVSVRGLVAVGGIVGKTESGALIEDCYVTGKVQGTYDHPSLGARTGGIAGWHEGGMIRRCYTKAQIIAPAKKGNGGIIGGPNTGSPAIEYSLSMSSGAGYRIAGFDVLDNVKEVYEYSGSGSVTNITQDNQALARERMEDEEMLKRMLYAYNYYDKWYGIDYSGVSLSSLMFFDGELLDRSMTASVLTGRLLTAAQAFFELSPEVQAAVAVQAEHTAGGTSSMSTTYRKLTAQEIGAMDLDSMEKLWDNRISIRNASSYPEKVGTATDGSYGFESFYTMNWYQSHNDSGSPDTHSFKRLGQEMLGVAGYEKGYMTYMSALSENDLDALRKGTRDEKITWRQYKLDRYREVEQKLDQIPYFDKDTVIAQFKAAFEADAVNGNTNQSFETKRMLYGMVKRVTGDFSKGGIYQNQSVIPVTSAEELIRLAAQNPYGYYRLENDIDFSGVTASGVSYIPGRFIGILDGNGCRMTGMQYPLFGDLQYAQVKDLTISAPSYAGDAQALFAVKTKKVSLGNVKVEDADMPLPLVKSKTEGYYEYGDMSVTVGDRKITTPEEFLAIGESAETLKKQYVLEADLDFSTLPSGEFAVRGTFSGELNGNGHSISGLDAVLFEKMDGASVTDLTITDSNLTADTQKGALANEIRNSTVEKIRVKNLVIENDANQAGGLAGIISGSEVRKISVEDISIRANNTIGGIAGQFDGRILEDCIVTGTLEGTSRHQMGARVGGITGWQGDGIMRRCLTKTAITAPDPVGNGGIIGGPQSGSAAVESAVSLSTGTNASRISGWDVLGITSSAYELETSDSISSMNETNGDRIFSVTEEQSRDPAFYIETLGWSEEVWDFERIPAGGLPGIR